MTLERAFFQRSDSGPKSETLSSRAGVGNELFKLTANIHKTLFKLLRTNVLWSCRAVPAAGRGSRAAKCPALSGWEAVLYRAGNSPAQRFSCLCKGLTKHLKLEVSTALHWMAMEPDELHGMCRSTAASQLALGSAIKYALLDSCVMSMGSCTIYIFIQIFPGEERQSCWNCSLKAKEEKLNISVITWKMYKENCGQHFVCYSRNCFLLLLLCAPSPSAAGMKRKGDAEQGCPCWPCRLQSPAAQRRAPRHCCGAGCSGAFGDKSQKLKWNIENTPSLRGNRRTSVTRQITKLGICLLCVIVVLDFLNRKTTKINDLHHLTVGYMGFLKRAAVFKT